MCQHERIKHKRRSELPTYQKATGAMEAKKRELSICLGNTVELFIAGYILKSHTVHSLSTSIAVSMRIHCFESLESMSPVVQAFVKGVNQVACVKVCAFSCKHKAGHDVHQLLTRRSGS